MLVPPEEMRARQLRIHQPSDIEQWAVPELPEAATKMVQMKEVPDGKSLR